jgi:hypothetical protein
MADIELNYSIEVGVGKKKGNRMTRYEVTEGVNRMESVESQLNISIEGVFAVMEGPDDDGDFTIELNYEVVSTGEGLTSDIEMTFVAYAENGQVLGQDTSWISRDSFIGIEPIEQRIYCKKEPNRFRLYPRPN